MARLTVTLALTFTLAAATLPAAAVNVNASSPVDRQPRVADRPSPTVRAAARRAIRPAPPPALAAPSGSVWDRLAGCESNGNWSINTGNGYSGGLQWAPSSWSRWKSPGDPPYAWQASREQEIAAGERYAAAERAEGRGGFGPWPACARKLGLPT